MIIPDLRFEPTYLAKLATAGPGWQSVVWVTIRDQVISPLLQGALCDGLAGHYDVAFGYNPGRGTDIFPRHRRKGSCYGLGTPNFGKLGNIIDGTE
ncbi:hypothetical protein H4582DRAFT_2079284 [Lactarius indigo]|nr:hypothetical protein H4582DRAFT_2079284 [Lactarius indigo]